MQNEVTIIQSIGGRDEWSNKQKAIFIAKHLGNTDLVNHLSKMLPSNKLITPYLNGLNNQLI